MFSVHRISKDLGFSHRRRAIPPNAANMEKTMGEQRQQHYEKKLEQGQTLPPPKDLADKTDQDRAKQASNNKK